MKRKSFYKAMSLCLAWLLLLAPAQAVFGEEGTPAGDAILEKGGGDLVASTEETDDLVLAANQEADVIPEEMEEGEALNSAEDENVSDVEVVEASNSAEGENVTGVEVADAILEIVEATSQMDLADKEGVERLQDYIAETQDLIAELPEEQQEALSESIGILEDASVSTDAMADAMEQLEETGSIVIEQTGMPNSWRFINGTPIDEAMQTVEGETEAVAEIVEEEAARQEAEETVAAEAENGATKDRSSESAMTKKATSDGATTENAISGGAATENATSGGTVTEEAPSLNETIEEKATSDRPATEDETSSNSTSTEETSTSDNTTINDAVSNDTATVESSSVNVSEDTSEELAATEGSSNETAQGEKTMISRSDIKEVAVTAKLQGSAEHGGAMVFYTPSGAAKKGIDVSRWQGTIDWQQVKNDGVKFAIIQCGWGNNLTSQDDKQWARNVSECERLKIPYGVYIYSYATNNTMVDSEAAHTLRLLKGHSPSLPVFWDCEENAQRALGSTKLSNLATRYCSQIRAAGYQAGVYASRSWWQSYMGPFAADTKYYHWVAEWSNVCRYDIRYEMWQYSSKGRVKGINGDVDMNTWYGNFPNNTAPKIVTPTPTPTPTPKPTPKPTATPTLAPAPDDGTWKKEKVNGKTVTRYYTKNNTMVRGQKRIGYYWYMFDQTTGAMVADQIYHHTVKTNPAGGEKWVYYDASGHMVYGQKKIGNYWYMFRLGSGAMVRDDFYHLWEFLNPKGGEKTCYYDANGHMVYGQKKIRGYWYMFRNGSGAMVTGFYDHDKNTNPAGGPKTCYYNQSGEVGKGLGAMLYGQRRIGGYWYMFHPSSGAMIRSAFYKHTKETNPSGGPKTCYYDQYGHMLYGRQLINGKWYNFHPSSGALM